MGALMRHACSATRKAVLLLLLLFGILFVFSSVAFAADATSIKYGWIALDASKKPVLQGTQYALTSKEVKPVAYISNGVTTKAVPSNAIAYLCNGKTGTGQALIIGNRIIGFKDAFITTFTIANTIDISKTSIDNIADQLWTGGQIKPKVTVKYGNSTLKENTDYKLSYDKNTAMGNGKVEISGIGKYTGKVTKSFKIGKVSMDKVTVAKIKPRYCNGLKQVTPKVTVSWQGKKLTKNKDYKVKYGTNKNPGEGSVTITGLGNYKGKVKKTFKLVNVGDIVAKAACRMSYSKESTKRGTDLYKKHWGGHHDCGGGMWAVYTSYTGYYKNLWHRGRKNWTFICNFTSGKDPVKCKMLPGDILVKDTGGFHTLMYVGSSIPKEIYKKYMKGKSKNKGNLGAPVKGTMFVSSHHSTPGPSGAPLCMCTKKWGGINWGTYKVYRITSDKSKWRAGQVVK